MRYWLLISFIWFFVGVREHGFFQAGGAATLTVGAELPHSELCVQNRKILTVFNKLRQSAISFFLNLAVIFIGVAVAFVLMQCHRYLKNHWTNENSSPRGRRMSAEEENSSSLVCATGGTPGDVEEREEPQESQVLKESQTAQTPQKKGKNKAIIVVLLIPSTFGIVIGPIEKPPIPELGPPVD